MKFVKSEEVEFEELPKNKQLSVIKEQLLEFAGRVVVAVGSGLGSIWYGTNTSPHTFVSSGEVVQVTTTNIVTFTVLGLIFAGIVGISAYKRRNLILDFVTSIQQDDLEEEGDSE